MLQAMPISRTDRKNFLLGRRLVVKQDKHHRHSGRIRSTENNTQCFSRKNVYANVEPEKLVHVISHVQVPQIPKIKSK